MYTCIYNNWAQPLASCAREFPLRLWKHDNLPSFTNITKLRNIEWN